MAATSARPAGRASAEALLIDDVPWKNTTTQATAKVPYMKTSEWAKLMSCRTPYTIV